MYSESLSNGTYSASSSAAGLTTTNTYQGETTSSNSTPVDQFALPEPTCGTVCTVGPVPPGLLVGTTTPSGETTVYHYYSDGDLAGVVTPLGQTTTYVYDGVGRVSSKTVTWSATYPGATTAQSTTATTSYTYYGDGQVKTEIDPTTTDTYVNGETHERETSYTYDADGNPETQRVTDLGTGADASRTTTWVYNAYDQEQSVTDPANHETQYAYYPDGLEKTVTDPELNVTEYAYDQDGNLTAKILENYDGSA